MFTSKQNGYTWNLSDKSRSLFKGPRVRRLGVHLRRATKTLHAGKAPINRPLALVWPTKALAAAGCLPGIPMLTASRGVVTSVYWRRPAAAGDAAISPMPTPPSFIRTPIAKSREGEQKASYAEQDIFCLRAVFIFIRTRNLNKWFNAGWKFSSAIAKDLQGLQQ